jgi:hypothetical protein
MYRTLFMASVLGLVLFASPAYAGIILPSATGTAAANSGWPVPPGSGNHSHGTFVNAGEMGVEEERGIVEFNLGAQSPEASVLLLFDNAPFQTCCSPTGVTGGSYSIGVYAYTGNSAYSVTDFDTPATFLLGSFSTAGMIVVRRHVGVQRECRRKSRYPAPAVERARTDELHVQQLRARHGPGGAGA